MPVRLLTSHPGEVTRVRWGETQPSALKPVEVKREQPTADREEVQELHARIAELNAASERTSRQAFEAGRQAGETEIRQACEIEVRSMSEKLAEAVSAMATARLEALRRAEGDTVRLAIEIARRVLHRELAVDSSAIEALVKAALEKLQSQEIYRVRVHPDQERLLRSCLEQAGRSQSIEIVADHGQAKGGAIFELSRGALDASVETQLREIERGLTDELQVRR